MEKVLIIGSGPIRIGQTGAFDEAACRACEVLKKADLQTIMVHCDPSAMATDRETADRTYMVPLSVASLVEVVLREKPDALLPTVGGATALRLAKTMVTQGLLDDHGIDLLGVSEKSLALIDDPSAFAGAVSELGLSSPPGQSTTDGADAVAIAETIGYPVFVRAVDGAGPVRYGIAFNVEELRALTAGGRQASQMKNRLRIEQALSGYREVEVDVLRDAANRMQVIGMAENMDPVGIHSGDSVAVIPPLTLTEQTRQDIEAAACKLASHAQVNGVLHMKFAVAPRTNQVRVLAMDPRFSRQTALCARAFDIDLCTIHAELALGMGLDEALAGGHASIARTMAGETVAIQLPRWEFDRFPGEAVRLDARMKSTGAVMGIGRNALEALQKAVRSRSPENPLLGHHPDLTPLDIDTLMRELVLPSPMRLQVMHEALKKGAEPTAIAAVTGIDIGWIDQLAELATLETQLAGQPWNALAPSLIERALTAGFSAAGLSRLLAIPESSAAGLLAEVKIKIRPVAPGDAQPSRIRFNVSTNAHTPHAPLGKSVLVVGPSYSRIGQSIELDHCCVHGSKALRAAGRNVIMINSNPASACGPKSADRTYIEPLTAADLETICRAERPEGAILQFGGYAAMDLAQNLEAAGIPVWGTAPEQVALSQDRMRFSGLLKDLSIPHPQIGVADTPEETMDVAETIGYPLVVTPQARKPVRQQTIITDARMLEAHIMQVAVSPEAPVLVEQFLEYAIEVEADALCDGRMTYMPAVMEHIELAGVHSGDSATVIPPYSTPPRHVDTIRAVVAKVALALGVKGVLNARFAVYNDTVYLLTVHPWACRTLPLVSKVCDVPMAKQAVAVMLGMTIDEMDLPRRLLPHYAIRSSVFPFDTFTEADPLLGPRMRSTGQAMVLADVFGMAYFTSQEAAGAALPLEGNVLITVTDADKPSMLEPARLFKEMGFGIRATRGTHTFLKKNGLESRMVKKLGFGRPDLVDSIKTGEVALVINTPSGSQSQQDDAYIRKTALRYHIPNITTPAGALAAAKGIAARRRGQDVLCTLQSYLRALK